MLSNASAMIRFRLKKQREVDSFYDSIPMYGNLEERYSVATEERYSFANLNLATRKLYKRLVDEIQIHMALTAVSFLSILPMTLF